uniref:non-specific serine/threonine protein kinase n=1 Tax=Astatotilapia calliptera TaxID=8154 RepID=A0AAX7THC7_ASTCA
MAESEKQMLVSKVNLLRELKHPNIVRYYDRIIDWTNTTLYIVMEYCEGSDLSSLISRCITFLVFVMVLGLLTQHNWGSTTFVGTPYYMSPEQINRMSYNEKSDIWSLGCLLYELCALSPPFTAYNQKELAEKIREGKFRRIPYRYSEELNTLLVFLVPCIFVFRSLFRPCFLSCPVVLFPKCFPFMAFTPCVPLCVSVSPRLSLCFIPCFPCPLCLSSPRALSPPCVPSMYL